MQFKRVSPNFFFVLVVSAVNTVINMYEKFCFTTVAIVPDEVKCAIKII